MLEDIASFMMTSGFSNLIVLWRLEMARHRVAINSWKYQPRFRIDLAFREGDQVSRPERHLKNFIRGLKS